MALSFISLISNAGEVYRCQNKSGKVVYITEKCDPKKQQRFDDGGFDVEPINIERESFQGYKGHDMYKIFKSIILPAEKDMYETTQQYNQRLESWKKQPLFGNLKLDDYMAITSPSILWSKSYNADDEKLTMESINLGQATENMSAEEKNSYFSFHTKHFNEALPTKIAKTDYGVKYKYKPFLFESYGVKVLGLRHIDFKVSPEDARRNIWFRVILIGKLEYPYLFNDVVHSYPSEALKAEFTIINDGILFKPSIAVLYDDINQKIIDKKSINSE